MPSHLSVSLSGFPCLNMHTILLVDAQKRYSSTGGPSTQLRNVLYKSFQSTILLTLQGENDTQVLGQPGKVLHVLLNELGSTIMIIEQSQYSVSHSIVRLSQTDVYAKNQVYNEMCEDIKLGLEKGANRFLPARTPYSDSIALSGEA